ncbi:MAG: hypothetical protein AB7I27_19690 [Bacteriovoracaceae bacterium]
MKKMIIALILFSTFAQSATPAFYCISTKTYQDKDSWPVNQIEIFTTEKGSLQMRLQYHAWGQSEGEDTNITTDALLKLKDLRFSLATKTLSHSSQKFVLTLGKALTPKQAEEILSKKDTGADFENPDGIRVEFQKYSLATLTSFMYPGKAEEWSAVLMDAFKAGVNEYICGDLKDIKK